MSHLSVVGPAVRISRLLIEMTGWRAPVVAFGSLLGHVRGGCIVGRCSICVGHRLEGRRHAAVAARLFRE